MRTATMKAVCPIFFMCSATSLALFFACELGVGILTDWTPEIAGTVVSLARNYFIASLIFAGASAVTGTTGCHLKQERTLMENPRPPLARLLNVLSSASEMSEQVDVWFNERPTAENPNFDEYSRHADTTNVLSLSAEEAGATGESAQDILARLKLAVHQCSQKHYFLEVEHSACGGAFREEFTPDEVAQLLDSL